MESLKQQEEMNHKLDKVLTIISGKGKGPLETQEPVYDSDEEKNFTTVSENMCT